MARTSELQRFAELLQSFAQLAHDRCDVHLRGSALPPPLGFAVRIQPDPQSAGVEMALSLQAARLRAWSGDGGRRGGSERVIHVDLSSGYRYECLLFPDADSLAVTLLRRMEDELAARAGAAGARAGAAPVF